jgi:chromosome segregation ATPase
MFSFEELDKRKLMRLFKNLCISKKKLDERKLARIRLDDKIEEVKSIYSKKRSKFSIDQIEREFEELKHHIEEVLEKEKSLIKTQQKQFITKDEFKNKLLNLEKKIDFYLNLKSRSYKRAKELEEKIKKTFENKEEEIKLLKSKIKSLEKYYRGLKKGRYSKKGLEKIRKRIQYLKKELKEVS